MNENGDDGVGGELFIPDDGDHDAPDGLDCPQAEADPDEDVKTLAPFILAKGEDVDAYAMKPDYT